MSLQGWPLFFSVFGIIFVAELPDKTALAAMVLATRHRPFAVILGAGGALTVQSTIAVAAGHLVSYLPARPVHIFAGVLFLVSAIVMWIRQEGADDAGKGSERTGFWRSAWFVFGVVFVAEWGDLTQLATAAIAARTRAPYTVFAGSTLALWTVAALAALVGNRASALLRPSVTRRIAAVLFAFVGVALLVGWI